MTAISRSAAIIRGETYHFELVANETARGLQDLGIGKRLAIGFGVLAVDDEAQAWTRARVSEGDRGGAAAKACLETIALKRQLLGQAR
jgi:6,7-dimethyl-8-ribityllumazine synthase